MLQSSPAFQCTKGMTGCIPADLVWKMLKIDMLGGNCPVQAEGTIDGRPFYFRARGQSWSMGIGGDVVGDPDWYMKQIWEIGRAHV